MTAYHLTFQVNCNITEMCQSFSDQRNQATQGGAGDSHDGHLPVPAGGPDFHFHLQDGSAHTHSDGIESHNHGSTHAHSDGKSHVHNLARR